MISSKSEYVANGVDLEKSFEGDEVLNRKGDRPLEDPPWKVLDTDLAFEPIVIKREDLDGTESTQEFIDCEDNNEEEASKEALPEELDEGDLDKQASEPEWAEVEEVAEQIIGISEEEAESRIAEAVAKAQVDLTVKCEADLEALRVELAEVKEAVERARIDTRTEVESEYQERLDGSRKTYDELTKKLAHATENLSEFFDPVSKLAVYIGQHLVRGELTVGPTAIARLVQGCLDALEGYQPKKAPVLKMHPDDLSMFLSGLEGQPEGVQMRADESMARGDVSLRMDDTAVEDLIDHRLEKLANHVFGMGQGITDELFRQPFETDSKTLAAVEDIEAFVDNEVLDVNPVAVKNDANEGQIDTAEIVVGEDVFEEVAESFNAPPELFSEKFETESVDSLETPPGGSHEIVEPSVTDHEDNELDSSERPSSPDDSENVQ